MKPTKVQLGGKTWTVRESTVPFSDCNGYCDAKKRIITLSKGLVESEKRKIFLHEAQHALYWFLDEHVVDMAAEELDEAIDLLDL